MGGETASNHVCGTFVKVHTMNTRHESRKTHSLSTPTSCSKTLVVISFLSVKYYAIKTGPNKSIGSGGQLSVYFTFLLLKCNVYKAKKD